MLFRGGEDGIYLRDKYFVPYEGIISFYEEKFYVKGVVIKRQYMIIYRDFISKGLFWKSGFSLWTIPVRKKDFVIVSWGHHGTTNMQYNETFQKLSSLFSAKTQKDLSFTKPF